MYTHLLHELVYEEDRGGSLCMHATRQARAGLGGSLAPAHTQARTIAAHARHQGRIWCQRHRIHPLGLPRLPSKGIEVSDVHASSKDSI